MEGDTHDPEASGGHESLSPSQELGSMASVLVALARTESVTLAPGTLVADQYRIERPIGEGGMGVVFLARDVHLDRAVAVKVCTGLSSSSVHRIQREAIVLAKLAHPNVVVLYQAGALDGRFFIAMEYVEGCNARQWLEREPRAWREIVDVYAQAARGLHAAHRVGIVHRDFKPDNVLVGTDGRVRVADFGLAQAEDELVASGEHVPAGAGPSLSRETSLTRTGAVAGTPAYMAPEQVQGQPLTASTDQFSFCVALHEALWGVRPFEDSAPAAAAPSTTRAVPRRLLEIVRRGLAADPHQRWPDMQALLHALLVDPGVRRRRVGLSVAGLVVVATSAWLAGSNARPEPCADVEAAIEGTWSAERRDEVAAALQHTGSPLAPAALGPVTAGLDAWAAEWGAQRRSACEATRVQGEQSEVRLDERMDCLDRVRIEGAAIVDVLRSPDLEVVVRAPTLVERLPDPSRCSDPEVLDDVDPVPPERRAVYEPLYARLAEIRAMLEVGRVEPANAVVEQLVTEADAEGFAGLAARATGARSQIRLELGRQDDAASDASAAIHYALRAHDDELLASASLALARALGRTSSSTDEALRWLDVCVAAAGRPARGPVRAAAIASVRVQILLYGDRPAEAERAARDALATLPEDDWARFTVLSMLGSAQQQLSRPDEAMATHREAIALAERKDRGEHPGITAALLNLALALQSAGRSAESLPLIERALTIRTAAYGASSQTAADAHRMLGDAYLGMSELASARAEYERALATSRANHDEAGQLFAAGNLAIVLKHQGDVAGARDLLLEVLPLAEHRFGATSRRVVEILLNLSGYLLELDQIGEAAARAERAMALAEQLESHSVLTLGTYINLAQIQGRQGRTDEALERLDRAAGLGMALLPPNAPEHAHVLLSRATVLHDAGRLDEAAEASSQGADAMERAWGPEGHETIEAQHAAGQHLLEAGATERARTRLERALEATTHTAVAPTLVAQIRWALARALWPERPQRARALALARSARDTLRARGDAGADEIEAWLADGRGPGGGAVPSPR